MDEMDPFLYSDAESSMSALRINCVNMRCFEIEGHGAGVTITVVGLKSS
jgi:hypothetical protein